MFGLLMAILACVVIGILNKSGSHLFFGFILFLVFAVGAFFTLLTMFH